MRGCLILRVGSLRVGSVWAFSRGMRVVNAHRLVFSTLVAVLGVLVFASAPALAETHRGFTASLGGKGTGAGQLEEPQGVAVNDTTGDVYVVDQGNNRIDEFEANGTFVRAWGWGVADGITEKLQTCTITCSKGLAGAGEGQLDAPEAIAVDDSGKSVAEDPSVGDVYVTNTADNVVEKFGASGEYEGEISTGSGGSPFGALDGVAVDPEGKLWVYYQEEIDDYSDALVNAFVASRNSPFGAGPGFAVDSGDNLLVKRRSRNVAKLNSSGGIINENVTAGYASSAVAVNLDSSSSEFDDVYINVGNVVEVFNPATTHVETFGELHSVSGSGIAVSSAGPVYVSDSAGDVVDVFTFGETPKEAPKTEAASEVLDTTATFNGELNPKGATGRLGYQFDYNTDGSCTGGLSVPVPAGEAAEAKEAIVEAKATNLQPKAKYTYCLVAVNTFGFTHGSEVPFETSKAPPSIISESTAAPVKATEATLEARINPENQETTYTFEYSSSEAEVLAGKGTKLAGAGPLTGFSSEGEAVSVETGSVLAQNTTYYYRVIAKNVSSEEAVGKVEHFTTVIRPETPVVVKPVKSVTATSATLEGVLNPGSAGNAGSYEFRYRASVSECEGAGGEASGGSALGSKAEVVKTEVTLLPYTSYTVCLRAYNEAGETSLSSPVTFTTLPLAPVIESEFSANVDATEARLEATIDPENAETAYHFEYGAGAGSYDVSTPVREIPAGLTGVGVNVVVTGLDPGTTYHYRVVASNALPGSVDGADKAFTTPAAQGSGSPASCPNEQLRAEQPYGLGLPDCRAYEMVSPVNTEGQDATDMSSGGGAFVHGVPRASVSGEAVTYASRGNFANPTGSGLEVQFLSRRGPEGWSTQGVTPVRHAYATMVATSYESDAFTPELTEGIASTNVSLTGEAPEGGDSEGDTELRLYVDNFANGSYQYVDDPFAPALYNRNLLDTTGTSIDLSHVVVSTIERSSGGTIGPVSEWMDGKAVLVSVTNGGNQIEIPAVGSVGLFNTWHAVSADGSRVYFSSYAYDGEEQAEMRKNKISPTPGQLYVRVNAEQSQSPMSGEECTVPTDACTIEVSASQRKIVDSNGPQTAYYWGASTNGSRVFFTSSAELTEDAYTGPADNAANLYEYDLERPVGERLKDLTVDKTDTDGAAVQGVAQISEDGSYVYFVAEGNLAAGAVVGEPNLYVSHDGGAPKFIATLAARDTTDWEGKNKYPEGQGGLETGTAVVTPNGSRLAFISELSLTGYDNEQAEPGECEEGISGGVGNETGKCREIYFYDAETGGLVCASCNPSGARPVEPSNFFPDAGNYDAHTGFQLYRPRNLLEDGALYFDSRDALVPHASDGRENVYEYEDGHVYPISDVAGGFDSFFMDASPNGDNVFFGSADQLLRQDTGNNVVVYDARADGGFPVTASPPSCDNGDSCKPPPAPQPGVFGAPGSATFSGPGNIPAVVVATPVVKAKAKSVKCKKGYEKKKNKCVKKAKRKAGKSSDRKGSK